MMTKLQIGVVTPTHPARRSMLERASRSVWQQDYPVGGHFVVCDNERRGAAVTRQLALEANPLPWTAFLDSDDWFMREHLRVLAAAAIETGADYVYSWYELVIFGKHQGDTHYLKDDGTLTDGVFPLTHFTEPWDPANPRHTTITTLVRTELAREVGFVTVPDDGEYAHRKGEDWEFTLGCNRLGKIHHVPQRTWYWSHHGNNSSGCPGQGDA